MPKRKPNAVGKLKPLEAATRKYNEQSFTTLHPSVKYPPKALNSFLYTAISRLIAP